MNLSEFGVIHNNFITELRNQLPELGKTINTVFEMKRKRKLRMVTDPTIKGNEGAEDSLELDWDVTANTEQAI